MRTISDLPTATRHWRHAIAPALLGALLAGCGNTPVPTPPPPQRPAHAPPAAPPVASVRGTIDSLDEYKILVADRVVTVNRAGTFSGRLPPMLPAIVVLTIGVDRDGKLTKLVVLRSRDHEASRVALAAFKAAEPLPLPRNLIGKHEKSLIFSETFLFNDQYRFQLRTLAGPQ